jgi:hypothetical protein
MTLATLFLSSLVFQGAKANDLRSIDVKPAGLSVSVPKAWGQNPIDGNLSASLKVPITDSKLFGKMDIGYVNDESKDVDEFLEATKSILTTGGNTVERQWKVDIMTSPLALTRFSKGGSTTVRGVLFRPTKSKFVLSISSPTEHFEKVEPFLLSTLESMKEVKVVQAKQPVVATERKVSIQKESPKTSQKLPIKHQVSLASKTFTINLPAGSKIVSTDGATISCLVAGLTSPVILTAYSSEGNPPSLIFQTKAAESSKLFTGGVQRIDQTSTNHSDRQIRDYIWRLGTSQKSGNQLMTCNCVITQAGSVFLASYYQFEGPVQFAKDRAILTKLLNSINLTEK